MVPLAPRLRRGLARQALRRAPTAAPALLDGALGLRPEAVAARVRADGPPAAWRGTDDGDLAQTRHADCLALAALLPRDAHVVDLGAGLGRVALVLALARPDLRLTGLEIDPHRVAAAQEAARRLGLEERVRFEVADLHTAPLPPADAWYAFLPFPTATARRVLAQVHLYARWRPAQLVLQGTWPELELDRAPWLRRLPAPAPLRRWRVGP